MRLTRRQILTPARIRVERKQVPKSTDPFPMDTCCAMRLTGGAFPSNCATGGYPTEGIVLTLGYNGPSVRICAKHVHWMGWINAKPRPQTCPGCMRRTQVFPISSEGDTTLTHALCSPCHALLGRAIGTLMQDKKTEACEMEVMHPEEP